MSIGYTCLTGLFRRPAMATAPPPRACALPKGVAMVTVFVALLCLGQLPLTTTSNGNGMMPCLYEGHLKTDKSWYGYLANITIMTSGAMIYEFSYPADKCCQNILFYTDDQLSSLRAPMNCFQKESLLRPENDQLLRLTPRFSWSGCRMTHPNSIPTLACSGGRSFSSVAYDDKPTTYYVAVSNCVGLNGLDLRFKLEVYGHIGECRTATTEAPTTTTELVPTAHAELIPKESASTQISDEQMCVLEGELNVTSTWYGFLANITLEKGGGFRFRLSYPYEMQVQNVILYNDEDVAKINHRHSCWQKDGIIRARNVPDQIIDLSFRSSWNGCVSRNVSGSRTLTCQGERRYEHARKIFIGVSNCRSLVGLYLQYRLEVTGFTGNLCSGARGTLATSGWLIPGFLRSLFSFPRSASGEEAMATTPPRGGVRGRGQLSQWQWCTGLLQLMAYLTFWLLLSPAVILYMQGGLERLWATHGSCGHTEGCSCRADNHDRQGLCCKHVTIASSPSSSKNYSKTSKTCAGTSSFQSCSDIDVVNSDVYRGDRRSIGSNHGDETLTIRDEYCPHGNAVGKSQIGVRDNDAYFSSNGKRLSGPPR